MKLLPCNCQNNYQDRKYGKGIRVHTPKAKNQGYRCTVCDNEKGS